MSNINAVDPKVAAALQTLTLRLEAASPEVASLLADIRAGRLGEIDALVRIAEIVRNNEHLTEIVEREALIAFAPLREESRQMEGLTLEPVDASAVLGPEFRSIDPIYQPPSGLPRLNPLYEAAIAERVQFDGDIPELRSGPMPEGGTPAVPVITDARDPVVIGEQLRHAAEAVKEEFRLLQAEGTPQLEDGAAKVEDDPELLAQAEAALERMRQNARDAEASIKAGVDFVVNSQFGEMTVSRGDGLPSVPEPKGYETRKPAEPRAVEKPPTRELLGLTPEERNMAAWRFLSTSQGRRSALGAIEKLVVVGLKSEGFEVEVSTSRTPRNVSEVPVYAEWRVTIEGPKATQSGFAFIDVAARALTKKLLAQLREAKVTSPVLEIIPINTVDVRSVGWAARVTEASP